MDQWTTAPLLNASEQKPPSLQLPHSLLFSGLRYCAPPFYAQHRQSVLQRDMVGGLERIQGCLRLVARRQLLATSGLSQDRERGIVQQVSVVKHQVDGGEAIRLLAPQALLPRLNEQRHPLPRQITRLLGDDQRLFNGRARDAEVPIPAESSEVWRAPRCEVEGALCGHALQA